MCLSIPMQLISPDGPDGQLAIAERGSGEDARRERVNMMLVGPQPVGTWVLVSLGLAREVLDDAERALIEEALQMLAESLEPADEPRRRGLGRPHLGADLPENDGHDH
ncbi:HypC/HybG/HupF family hydrogenase formation chaperone [Accumulibacter sp.]|uniref:HypC/HybG/HupF family hydrogenase formation chaperone n=1 Tax=Accumulibacter sp. TaxID=2053492 RepID=UPI0025F6FD96|nr:HypC/HybG/HupF family hydrogenase formation chaperone [Accumulibacter sp.]MCM8596863.1 HypC/HybG/HupF family hydrogenase formation chaperone [Accumulibacter sp.]MCM8624603.1 HypC/HybG/HupF family hydrogenase formation chaperone [Accumulibacter sp.]MDS4051011.1 HypC/HybG/HupF family hydrogenase formation chaperone [Accumulibacter sp.]